MTAEEAYEVLGLGAGATAQDAKLAYRRLALEHHPDRFSDESERAFHVGRFKQARDAYEVLRREGFPELLAEPVPEPDFSPKTAGRSFGARDDEDPRPDASLVETPSWSVETVLLWGVVVPGGAAVLAWVVRAGLAALR